MYKVTTQYTPFELVYGTQLVVLAEYLVPIQQIQDVLNDDIEVTIQVRMDDLVHIDEKIGKPEKI
jgi:hypothetical protein